MDPQLPIGTNKAPKVRVHLLVVPSGSAIRHPGGHRCQQPAFYVILEPPDEGCQLRKAEVGELLHGLMLQSFHCPGRLPLFVWHLPDQSQQSRNILDLYLPCSVSDHTQLGRHDLPQVWQVVLPQLGAGKDKVREVHGCHVANRLRDQRHEQGQQLRLELWKVCAERGASPDHGSHFLPAGFALLQQPLRLVHEVQEDRLVGRHVRERQLGQQPHGLGSMEDVEVRLWDLAPPDSEGVLPPGARSALLHLRRVQELDRPLGDVNSSEVERKASCAGAPGGPGGGPRGRLHGALPAHHHERSSSTPPPARVGQSFPAAARRGLQ
mmetsp:Transcript_27657/g.82535  ORF Transcript_27657/g.82535 Transcript_27657/m.82535 type:complete len:323 (-) Transcript_27657:294-1262(-)